MRIDAGFLQDLVRQASTLVYRQSDIAQQLSSGTRLTTLAADPAAAAASVRLSSDLAERGATLTAMQLTQSRLQSADSALAAVVERLTSAVSLAVQAANDTTGTGDRAALATQLFGIKGSVLTLANSSLDGNYLFAGTSGSEPFHQDAGGSVTYSGDDVSTSLSAGGNTIQASAAGSAVFGTGSSSIFSRLDSVVQSLQQGQTLSANQVSDLRASLQTIIEQRSLLGTSGSRLQSVAAYTKTQQADLQVQQTEVAASDPVALATELSAAQTQRQALLSSLAILGKGSLFDYL